MSGGYFSYANNTLQNEIFRHSWTGQRDPRDDPFHDVEISDLVYDVFDIINALDYYESADFSEGTYRKKLTVFKDKWFGKGAHQKRLVKYIDDQINRTRADLIAMVTGQPVPEGEGE